MYSTVIRQQHMIDRTEQETLLLSFIAQKYYKTKGSNTERHKAQCAEWSRAQNDALETTRRQHAGWAALRVCIEKISTEGRDIDK